MILVVLDSNIRCIIVIFQYLIEVSDHDKDVQLFAPVELLDPIVALDDNMPSIFIQHTQNEVGVPFIGGGYSTWLGIASGRGDFREAEGTNEEH